MAAKQKPVTFYATASVKSLLSLPLKAKTFEDALAEAKTLKGYQFIKDGTVDDYDNPEVQTIFKV